MNILAVTGPIYLIIAAGYLSVRGGLFVLAEMRVLGKLVINFCSPATVFRALSQQHPADVLNGRYLAALHALGMAGSNSAFVAYPNAGLIRAAKRALQHRRSCARPPRAGCFARSSRGRVAASKGRGASVKSDVRVEPDDLIAGLGRGLAVIECFDDEHARLTPAEVAERTQISRTAARRYLLSLCHFGYAHTNGKTFWLAPRVLRLGQSYLLSARLPRLAQPFLEQLSQATRATAGLAVLDEHDVIYLARQGGARLANAGVQLGARLPAHVVSVGRAILSCLPDDALDAWIAAHRFSCFTVHSEKDPARFREQIVAMRALNYVLVDQQLELGWRGLAVPLRDRHGECQGALSVTMPVEGNSPESMLALALAPLREAEAALRGLL